MDEKKLSKAPKNNPQLRDRRLGVIISDRGWTRRESNPGPQVPLTRFIHVRSSGSSGQLLVLTFPAYVPWLFSESVPRIATPSTSAYASPFTSTI